MTSNQIPAVRYEQYGYTRFKSTLARVDFMANPDAGFVPRGSQPGIPTYSGLI
jgi:hypothetical protein